MAALAVQPRPRIGLLISGDELVSPGVPRGPGAIWESNRTLLEALLARLGQAVAERRLVADEPVALAAALEELAARCDVVVSTGGVSAGDADWIRPLLAEQGSVDFWKLFLKPGRPFAFGRLAGKPFFGLPGNPVAGGAGGRAAGGGGGQPGLLPDRLAAGGRPAAEEPGQAGGPGGGQGAVGAAAAVAGVLSGGGPLCCSAANAVVDAGFSRVSG